jgi:hypothetical protein
MIKIISLRRYFPRSLSRHRHRVLIAVGLALTLPLAGSFGTSTAPGPGGMTLEGVNISGGEFTPTAIPGVMGTNYIFPSNTELFLFL